MAPMGLANRELQKDYKSPLDIPKLDGYNDTVNSSSLIYYVSKPKRWLIFFFLNK